jgi:hypothetical protein
MIAAEGAPGPFLLPWFAGNAAGARGIRVTPMKTRNTQRVVAGILLPTYNRSHFFGEAIRSVNHQTHRCTNEY